MIIFLTTLFFASANARAAGVSGMITPSHPIKPAPKAAAEKPAPEKKPCEEEILKKEIAELKAQLAKNKDYRGLAQIVYGSYVKKIKDDVIIQLEKNPGADVVIDNQIYASYVEKTGDVKRVTLICYATGDEIEATINKDGKVGVDSVQLNLDPAPVKKKPAGAEKAAEKAPEKKAPAAAAEKVAEKPAEKAPAAKVAA